MRLPSLAQIDPALVIELLDKIASLETQLAELRTNSYTKEQVDVLIKSITIK